MRLPKWKHYNVLDKGWGSPSFCLLFFLAGKVVQKSKVEQECSQAALNTELIDNYGKTTLQFVNDTL